MDNFRLFKKKDRNIGNHIVGLIFIHENLTGLLYLEIVQNNIYLKIHEIVEENRDDFKFQMISKMMLLLILCNNSMVFQGIPAGSKQTIKIVVKILKHLITMLLITGINMV